MRRVKKKGFEAKRMKPPTTIQAIDEFIGKEEQKEKRKIWSDLQTQDHSVASYDPQELYSEPILLNPGSLYCKRISETMGTFQIHSCKTRITQAQAL